jgi:hypothetical protein
MRVGVAAVLVLVLGVAVLVAWIDWSLRHMQIGLLSTAAVGGFMARVELVRDVMLLNRSCLFTVDESSKGDQKKEAEMRYIAAMLDLYRAKFGRAASSVTDLNKLSDFDNASKLNGRQLEKECSIYAYPRGSFAVSCGSSRPRNADVAAFRPRTDAVERFYELGGHEILYVPAQKC